MIPWHVQPSRADAKQALGALHPAQLAIDKAKPLGTALLETLERMRCGGIILNASGEVTQLNSAAKQYLCKYACVPATTSPSDWTRALRWLIGSRKGHSAADADLWVPIANVGAPKLILYARRISNGEEGALTVLTLVDLSEPAQPSGETLQKLFGLTSAEARLALEIARGASPSEAAETLGIKIPTVRTQLSMIFAKTGAERQGELVALLARLTVLP